MTAAEKILKAIEGYGSDTQTVYVGMLKAILKDVIYDEKEEARKNVQESKK